MNHTILGIIAAIVILGGLIFIARPDAADNAATPLQSNGTLTVEEANNYDFGTISMAAGNVAHQFKLKNIGSEPVAISKIYTSCMCTTATLSIENKKLGPFGMPGHGAVPKINQALAPSEDAVVEVVFDPAAHGPAGVGRIERTITIENNTGRPIELLFTAMVTP